MRILVIMPNWLGDLVMATPLLELLHNAGADGGLQLHACVRRRWAPLLMRDPRLDGLVIYERTGRHAGWRGVASLAADLRDRDYDAVILGPPSLRMGMVAMLAHIPSRVGYATGGRGPLLTLPLSPVRPRGRVHHADELRRLGLALLETLGRPAPPSSSTPSLPGVAGLVSESVPPGPPLWILAPGATYGPAKNWPTARLAEFLEMAVGQRQVRLAIVGDTAAVGLVSDLRQRTSALPWRREMGDTPGVVDLVGGTTLMDLAALLERAQAFLGNDSGVMHVAAALGVPTLGLYGSSSAAWTAPRGRHAAVLTAEGFPCQPCFRKTCNQAVFCLDTLSGRRVFEALDDLVAKAQEGAPS
jgi:heptosyltransferase-2